MSHAFAGPSDGTVLNFSTRGLAEHDRLPMWREEFGRGIVRVDPTGAHSNRYRVIAT